MAWTSPLGETRPTAFASHRHAPYLPVERRRRPPDGGGLFSDFKVLPVFRSVLRAAAIGGLLLLSACASVHIPATPQTAFGRSETSTLSEGVTYWSETRENPLRQVFHVVRLDLANPKVQLFVSPPNDGAGQYHARTTSDFVTASGALLAVNASYFTPFKPGARGGDDFVPHAGQHVDPVGKVIVAGAVVAPPEVPELDPRVNAILCIHPSFVEIRSGHTCRWDVIDAVAAGPVLLVDGVEQSFKHAGPKYAADRHPRTALGVSADGRTGWLVVVDGRQTVISEGATLAELTAFFRDLGAADAINLDGGGSTTLAVDDGFGRPRVLNSPIHTGVPGRERPVANQLGVRVLDAR